MDGDGRSALYQYMPDRHSASARFRVCFVYGPDAVCTYLQNYGAEFMPVWAYTLAAHLPDDGRVRLALCDMRLDDLDRVTEADVFLLGGINQNYGNLIRVRCELKRRVEQMIRNEARLEQRFADAGG